MIVEVRLYLEMNYARCKINRASALFDNLFVRILIPLRLSDRCDCPHFKRASQLPRRHPTPKIACPLTANYPLANFVENPAV